MRVTLLENIISGDTCYLLSISNQFQSDISYFLSQRVIRTHGTKTTAAIVCVYICSNRYTSNLSMRGLSRVPYNCWVDDPLQVI